MNQPSHRNTFCWKTIRNTSQCTPRTVATQGRDALGMSSTRMNKLGAADDEDHLEGDDDERLHLPRVRPVGLVVLGHAENRPEHPQEPDDADRDGDGLPGLAQRPGVEHDEEHAAHGTDQGTHTRAVPLHRSSSHEPHCPVCLRWVRHVARDTGHNRRMDLSSDPDEVTHQLAAARPDDPTAWFDDLYRAAGDGRAELPWGPPDRQPAARRVGRAPRGRRVGPDDRRGRRLRAGLGVPRVARLSHDRVRHLARRGGADPGASPRQCGHLRGGRPPGAAAGVVRWVRPGRREHERPGAARAAAQRRDPRVAGLVAPGGILVVIAFGADGTAAERDRYPGPPAVGAQRDRRLAGDGVDLVAVERVFPTTTCAGGRPSDGVDPTRRGSAAPARSRSAGREVGVGAPNMLP